MALGSTCGPSIRETRSRCSRYVLSSPSTRTRALTNHPSAPKLYWASQQLYIIDQLLIKVSTLALYMRVFPTPWFSRTVIVLVSLITVQDTVFFLLVMVRCIPIQAIWDILTPGRCLDLNLIGLSGAYLGIIEHFIILFLPLPELWKLSLSRKKRIQLALVFSLGSLYVCPSPYSPHRAQRPTGAAEKQVR